MPSAVSAIKIDGQRAYKRVRGGEEVALPARRVTISRLEVLGIRRDGDVVDVDVDVTARPAPTSGRSPGTPGLPLGVGGHLTALRRTAVGGFTLAEAAPWTSLRAVA